MIILNYSKSSICSYLISIWIILIILIVVNILIIVILQMSTSASARGGVRWRAQLPCMRWRAELPGVQYGLFRGLLVQNPGSHGF